MKKTLSIILALILSLLMIPVGIISSAAVGEVDTGYTPATGSIPISSVSEFEAMGTGNYHLTKNLDFSGKTYTESVVTGILNGTLDGCGYSITGIKVNSTGAASVFADLKGTIKNLTIGTAGAPAKISSTGEVHIGALVDDCRNECLVENVKIYADVKSPYIAGGFVGYLASPNAVFRNCEMNGSVTIDSTKENGRGGAAGIVARAKSCEYVLVENCINNADISMLNYKADDYGTGGVIGRMEIAVTIKNCVNTGDVTTNSNYAGGVAGLFRTGQDDTQLLVQGCTNYGTVSGMYTGLQGDGSYQLVPETNRAAIGGILAGDKYFTTDRTNLVTVEGCMNCGLVKTNGASAGAIMGKGTAVNDDGKTLKITIKDSGNVGRVEYGNTAAEIGTFVSIAATNTTGNLSITNCFNMGTTNSTKAYAAVYNMLGDPTLDNAVVSDFYFLDTQYNWAANSVDIAISNAVKCTADQFKSGEVAFNLGFNFGQVIGEDDYPTPGATPVMATGSDSAPFANLRSLSTKTGGASAVYSQTTEVDTQGKQAVRFIIAVDSEALLGAASAQMVITFKKTGAADVSYTLNNDEIKFYKSLKADGELYLADDGCAILGAIVTGVTSDAWSSVEVTFTAKDAAEIALLSTSGACSK